MDIRWTAPAKECFSSIKSRHFTDEETKHYKKMLALKIHRKILDLMESSPASEPEWNGTYRILVDRFKVYYSFSEEKNTCYILGFKHQRQK